MTPSPGTAAPAFDLEDDAGRRVTLADLAGRRVVLYFYPKDDTPGCTAQACSLRDGFSAIKSAGAVILGVSADTGDSHRAFAEKFHLPFSILADPERRVIEAYGVKTPLIGWARRVTFLIDKQGVIRHILRDIRTKDHDQQVLELLKGMK